MQETSFKLFYRVTLYIEMSPELLIEESRQSEFEYQGESYVNAVFAIFGLVSFHCKDQNAENLMKLHNNKICHLIRCCKKSSLSLWKIISLNMEKYKYQSLFFGLV